MQTKAKYIFLFLLLSNCTFGQSKKNYNIYIQANPIFSFNNYTSTGEGNETLKMKQAVITFGTGLEVEKAINRTKTLKIVPFLKWYIQKQGVSQYETFGFFNKGSYFVRSFGFWNLNIGLLMEKRINTLKNVPFNITGGVSFSHIYQDENLIGYHLNYNNYYPYAVGFDFYSNQSMDDFSMRINHLNLLLGIRSDYKIKGIGKFKLGLLAIYPFGKMPTYNFQTTFTSNNEFYFTNTYTTSRQMNVELSILYKLFSIKM